MARQVIPIRKEDLPPLEDPLWRERMKHRPATHVDERKEVKKKACRRKLKPGETDEGS